MFAGGPVTWSSKKQSMVALSSCESEYIALSYASQDAVYLSDVLSELTFPQFSSVQMYEASMGALQLLDTTAFSFSARPGCIEQGHRISCQDNRSVGGHFHHILGLPEL